MAPYAAESRVDNTDRVREQRGPRSNADSSRALLGLPATPPASRSCWTMCFEAFGVPQGGGAAGTTRRVLMKIRIIQTMSYVKLNEQRSLNMQLRLVEMRGAGDLDNAFRAVIDGGCDALYVVSSRQTVSNIPPIVDFATRNKLPLAGGWGAWALAGGLLSYGPNVDDLTRRVVNYLDKILKGANRLICRFGGQPNSN